MVEWVAGRGGAASARSFPTFLTMGDAEGIDAGESNEMTPPVLICEEGAGESRFANEGVGGIDDCCALQVAKACARRKMVNIRASMLESSHVVDDEFSGEPMPTCPPAATNWDKVLMIVWVSLKRSIIWLYTWMGGVASWAIVKAWGTSRASSALVKW